MTPELSGGPLMLIRKLARASGLDGFRDSPEGLRMASRALALVRRENPEQADLFLTELVMLGFNLENP